MKPRNRLLTVLTFLVGSVFVLWRSSRAPDLPPVSPPAPDEVSDVMAGGDLPTVAPQAPVMVREEVAPVAVREPQEAAEPVEGAEDPMRSFWCRLVPASGGGSVNQPAVTAWTGRVFLQSKHCSFDEAQGDDQGLVEIILPTESVAIGRVDAAGFGTTLFNITQGHSTPEDALEVGLVESASLVIRLTDATSAPMADVWVRIEVPPYEVAGSEGGGIYGSDVFWTAKTGLDGTCTFGDLPAEVGLEMDARREGELLYKAPRDLILAPGEDQELEWNIGVGSQVNGWLLDQFGGPVKGRKVWLTQTGLNVRPERDRFYFYVSDDSEITQSTKTDDRGHFTFDDVSPGRWFIGPSPYERHGNKPGPDSVAAVATAIDIPEGGLLADVNILVHRGLYIRGVVVDSSGEPIDRFYLRASGELGLLAAIPSGASFTLGPLDAVEHSLGISSTENFAPRVHILVTPPISDFSIELRVGATLSGRFVDAASGQPCEAGIIVSSPDSRRAKGSGFLLGQGGLKSEFSVDGFGPGTYNLSARTTDGRVGYLSGVQLKDGAVRDDLELRLELGGTLKIHYTGASEYANFRVLYEGVLMASSGVQTGTSVLEIVPAGRLRIEVYFGSTRVAERVLECAPGDELEIDFDLDLDSGD